MLYLERTNERAVLHRENRQGELKVLLLLVCIHASCKEQMRRAESVAPDVCVCAHALCKNRLEEYASVAAPDTENVCLLHAKNI